MKGYESAKSPPSQQPLQVKVIPQVIKKWCFSRWRVTLGGSLELLLRSLCFYRSSGGCVGGVSKFMLLIKGFGHDKNYLLWFFAVAQTHEFVWSRPQRVGTWKQHAHIALKHPRTFAYESVWWQSRSSMQCLWIVVLGWPVQSVDVDPSPLR